MLPKETIARAHSIYISEHAADRAIIASLLRENKKLRGDITMSKIIKSIEGDFYLVHDYEKLTAEQVVELKNTLEADVKLLQEAEAVLATATDAPVDTTADAQGEVKPSSPELEAQIAADQAAAPAVPAPEVAPTPVAPVDQPVAPVVDPTAQVPVAPIATDVAATPVAPVAPVDQPAPVVPAPAIQ